ncbi:MAG: hypothetical protein GXO76_05615 [Calditrichaeota bacterium]|nr:hypothetical protein [Calditrichota bacterium]
MKKADGHLKLFLVLLLIVAGFEFIFLVSYAPFLHNHPLNQPERGECPAYIIETMLITPSPMLLVVIFILFITILWTVIPLEEEIPTEIISHLSTSRSPPAFSN